MRKAKALIFDLDDTLFDSTLAYEKALASLSLGLKDPRYLQARQLVKAQLPPQHVSARNRLLYFKTLLISSKTYSPAATLALVERYERRLGAEVRRQWRVLKRNMLFSVLSRRFPMVVLSNENTRTQLVKLEAADPRSKFFKHLVTSEEVGVEKPHRRMFEAARRLLKLPYRDCVMIGDSFSDDIRPALSLGMQAVLTREFTRAARPLASRVPVIDALEELPVVLA